MATAQDICDAIAALLESQQTQAEQTNEAIRALAAAVGPPTPGGGGAAPPVPVTDVQQNVRKSTEATVQLSLADSQFTDNELGATAPRVRPPVGSLTYANSLPETTPF